ncbi:Atu4866 domain-containing protein [Fulvimarina sp. MAC8]|uniref:Atu4866 domain-containing protein n=1 Tax=Fulvimarina sp. MAC8 TaxID=3162874 RepID=UPI0032EF7349
MKRTTAAAAVLAATVTVQSATAEEKDMTADHPYVGLWATEDDRIRHELLPNSRYVEARGSRERAYEGRYEVTGAHIEYWDDTGFTADGDFIDDVLYHAGMVLYRQRVQSRDRAK